MKAVLKKENFVVDPEADFLACLFARLNEEAPTYTVLRGYEELPRRVRGDLDILTLTENRDRIAHIIEEAARLYGGVSIIDYVGSGRFIRILGCCDGVWWGVAIDLFSSIEYRGISYGACGKIMEKSKIHGTVKVADADDSVILALVKELLSNGRTRKNYFEAARAIWARKRESCFHFLDDGISKSTLDYLAHVLATDDADLVQLTRLLRTDVLSCGDPGKRISNLWSRYRRLLHPPGISMAVLGTDGAGKSTVIEAVKPVLEKALHSSIHYEHLRPNWVPKLGNLVGKKATSHSIQNPHAQKSSGLLGSLFRLCYYAIDYYAGYWIKIHVKLAKEPKLAVFDRYFYDFILDPSRLRVSLPGWLVRAAMACAPKPDLVFCLGTEPEKIYHRKPETSLTEVTRQVCELKRLCRSTSRAVWVDTGSGVNESRDVVLRAIQNVMGNRR